MSLINLDLSSRGPSQSVRGSACSCCSAKRARRAGNVFTSPYPDADDAREDDAQSGGRAHALGASTATCCRWRLVGPQSDATGASASARSRACATIRLSSVCVALDRRLAAALRERRRYFAASAGAAALAAASCVRTRAALVKSQSVRPSAAHAQSSGTRKLVEETSADLALIYIVASIIFVQTNLSKQTNSHLATIENNMLKQN